MSQDRYAAQRASILARRPWEKSTGAKSKAGKQRARLNGLRHGGAGWELAVKDYLRAVRRLIERIG